VLSYPNVLQVIFCTLAQLLCVVFWVVATTFCVMSSSLHGECICTNSSTKKSPITYSLIGSDFKSPQNSREKSLSFRSRKLCVKVEE